MDVYISADQMGTCKGCRKYDDLRMGYCFDCADAGERRAAERTVLQHITEGAGQFGRGYRTEARISFQWAWERLTRTGDYKPGGEFEHYFRK